MSDHCVDECVDYWKSKCEFLQGRVDVLESIIEDFLEKIFSVDCNEEVQRKAESGLLQETSSCS